MSDRNAVQVVIQPTDDLGSIPLDTVLEQLQGASRLVIKKPGGGGTRIFKLVRRPDGEVELTISN